MIPISLLWDTRKRFIRLAWDGFLSVGWEKGRMLARILGIPVSCPLKKRTLRVPVRPMPLREAVVFLKAWRIKRVEGTISLPDPMVNGVLYGWLSAVQSMGQEGRVNVTVSFLGENSCSGEAVMPFRALVSFGIKRIFSAVRNRGRF